MARVIHFASHGAHGLAFECFHEERERHMASGDWKHRTVPEPIVRSDLRKVTCPRCWAEIKRMAQERA